jgi:hypothetical protein
MNPTLPKARYSKLVFVALLLTVSGCNQVICKRPVGEKPANIVAAEWEGNWIGPDGAIAIKVVDAERATLKVVWLEDEAGQPAMKTAAVELRESGDWLFANTLKDGEASGYLWARIKKENRQILLWEPDERLFVKLVRAGIFPGRVDQNSVIVEELNSEHLNLIKSGELGVPFTWDQPLILVRALN